MLGTDLKPWAHFKAGQGAALRTRAFIKARASTTTR